MFHTPAHHSTTAAQVAIKLNAKVDCPRCGGLGDHGTDETGRLYACYCCGMTGRVELGVGYAEYANGAHARYEAELAEQEWRARREARKQVYIAKVAADYTDDIPF